MCCTNRIATQFSRRYAFILGGSTGNTTKEYAYQQRPLWSGLACYESARVCRAGNMLCWLDRPGSAKTGRRNIKRLAVNPLRKAL
jgi:hypothetical protein